MEIYPCQWNSSNERHSSNCRHRNNIERQSKLVRTDEPIELVPLTDFRQAELSSMFVYAGIWWLCFVCSLTLLGNVLVILAVVRETTLHSATYYYIVSLAVADLCVGILVIPLAILFELSVPDKFDILCHLWHITDVGASTASILALCVIAVDRYLAITSPIRYRRSFLVRRSSFVIGLIWFCSSIIAGPMVIIIGERFHSINSSLQTDRKRCEFPSDPTFVVVSSSVSFYIPLLIMVFVYSRVLISARRQMTALRQGYKRTTTKARHQTTIEHVHVTQIDTPEIITLRIHRGKYSRSPSVVAVSTNCRRLSQSSSSDRPFLHRLTRLRRTRTWTKFSREHKPTKVLGVIMGVFIACWLPFFVFLPLTTVFHVRFHPYEQDFFRLFTWLGYTNSALNFFVYVLTSREFRLAFIKLLCSRNYVQRSFKQHSQHPASVTV